MKKFYYYAKLNDNNVCVEIVSRVDKLSNVTGYVEIPEYNETLRYRKWLGNQWSQEIYEPNVDTSVQDKINELEENLQRETLEKATLINRVNELEGAIMELTSVLASLTGGVN